jgi:hypothetical protein
MVIHIRVRNAKVFPIGAKTVAAQRRIGNRRSRAPQDRRATPARATFQRACRQRKTKAKEKLDGEYEPKRLAYGRQQLRRRLHRRRPRVLDRVGSQRDAPFPRGRSSLKSATRSAPSKLGEYLQLCARSPSLGIPHSTGVLLPWKRQSKKGKAYIYRPSTASWPSPADSLYLLGAPSPTPRAAPHGSGGKQFKFFG